MISPAGNRSRGIGWFLLNAFTVLVYLFMFAPIVIVIILAFNSADYGGFPMLGLSLRWFAKLWENQAVIGAMYTSLTLGVLTSLIGTLIALLAAMAIVRHRIPGRKAIGALIVAPLLVPETVLAVGLLLLLKALGLPRTYLLLLAGHILITLPFAALVIHARLAGMGKRYEEAAASLGARSISIFISITLPLSMPAIIAALLFTFTISFDNLTASLFWRPSGVDTVPIQIFSMLRDSVSPEINALGTVMILVTIGLSLAAGLIGNRMTVQKKSAGNN